MKGEKLAFAFNLILVFLSLRHYCGVESVIFAKPGGAAEILAYPGAHQLNSQTGRAPQPALIGGHCITECVLV